MSTRAEGGNDTPSVQYAYETDTPQGGKVTYVRLDKITYPAGREVHYNYPASGVGAVLGRLDNVAADGDGTTKYVQYTYLGAGVIVKAAHPAVTGGLNLSYGTGGTYGGWDRFGRVTDQNWSNDSPAVKDRFRYGYDRNSNRTWRENYEARQQSAALDEYYTYDGLDRLTNVDRGTLSGTHPSYSAPSSPTLERDYTLNQLGDWSVYVEKTSGSETLAQTRTHNAANEIYHATYGSAITETTGASWIDPVHDAAGNMTSGPKAGAETTRLHMVYDAWNRLARVYEDDGDGQFEPGGDDALIATYRYDGRHFRNRRIVGNDTFDYYDNGNWQVLEERKNGSANAQVQYVWDERYIHSPALRWRDENCDGQDVETLYYTNDANFNVTALVDTSGNVAERYVYDAYGKATIYNADFSATVSWENSKKNVVLYTGHKLDVETGLYYGNRRYYHPTLGRWVSPDPLGYMDGNNLYEYVGSRPLVDIDPRGLSWAMTISAAESARKREYRLMVTALNKAERTGNQEDWDQFDEHATREHDLQKYINHRKEAQKYDDWKDYDKKYGRDTYEWNQKQHGYQEERAKWREKKLGLGDGKSIYDYIDLKVTCEECLQGKTGVGDAYEVVEVRCRERIAAKAGDLAARHGITGGSAIVSGVLVWVGGALSGTGVGTIPGVIIYGAGTIIEIYGVYEVSVAMDIRNTGQKAMDTFCDCDNIVR